MAKTPGKIGEGRPTTSQSMIASEGVLFGQPVEYNSSNDEKGDIYDSGNFAGVAVYDPSAGTDDSRQYEQYDVMEVLREGVAKVRIDRDLSIGGNTYYSYLSAGDPVYAVPDGYFSGSAYFSGNVANSFVSGPGATADNASNISGGDYFGHPVGEALESTPGEGDHCVILVDFNRPEVN